ncbi:MAG TPA: gluconate 2-dehydrogenase subunit 3 family protein [Gemmatimonadaceae bacterium]|nr:gluconate 2-dehydrogenase subunit 3 family protein [Gemmatimonadaceae bacterium]
MTTRFFDGHQRATIEAAMSRIIPTDDTPGAREAGTIDFLDRYLGGIDSVYAKPDGSGFERLTGKRADAWQRRLDIVRERYVAGVAMLDRTSRELYDGDFVALTEEQQDAVLRKLERPDLGQEEELERARVTMYGAPVEPALQQTSAEIDLGFVPLLALHTRQGFYADPIYGGNRDHIGWQVIGFPGPASLAEVHSGRYSTLEYFATNKLHPGQKD